MKYGLQVHVVNSDAISVAMPEAMKIITERLMTAGTKPGERIKYQTLKINVLPSISDDGYDIVGEVETNPVPYTEGEMMRFYLEQCMEIREEERNRRVEGSVQK